MIEVVITFHVFLLILNLKLIKNIAAPSFLYTFIWFIVLLLHFLVAKFNLISINSLSNEILLFFLLGTIFFNAGSFFSIMVYHKSHPREYKTKFVRVHNFFDNFMLLIPLLFLPVVYLKSLYLAYNSGIENLFLGLRYQKNYGGESLGVLQYLTIWAIFDATWRYLLYKHNVSVWMQKGKMIVAFSSAFFYAILSTGKTFPFLIIITLIGLKFLANEVKIKQGVIFVSSLFLVFFFFSVFLEKGASPNNSFTVNLILVNQTLLNYMLGPQSALDSVFQNSIAYDLGFNSFRFFFAFFYKIGISDIEPFNLVQVFTFVPFPTNAYTYYYPYILDFGVIFSFLTLFIFGFFHTKSFLHAKRGSLVYSYIYALMLYPLFMSFFQDQYLSLLSTWLQFAIFILFEMKFILVKLVPKYYKIIL
ncbi:MAG: oligosaccharide repeat unit polymerase [Chlorobi bacterium]|nr:oligosaccharide repeat unit polymerase [Chlorobiota bacterium]